MSWPRTNKFNAQPTVYGGVRFDSKREADFARQLDLMKHAQGKDKVESWQSQIRFPLVVNDVTIGHYVCDFLVKYADGRTELVEIKSSATVTPLFKFKLKFFQATWLADHPHISYRIENN